MECGNCTHRIMLDIALSTSYCALDRERMQSEFRQHKDGLIHLPMNFIHDT